jgi:hypothetical protein
MSVIARTANMRQLKVCHKQAFDNKRLHWFTPLILANAIDGKQRYFDAHVGSFGEQAGLAVVQINFAPTTTV